MEDGRKRQEPFCFFIEAIDLSIICFHPEMMEVIFCDLIDTVIFQMRKIAGSRFERNKAMAIEAVDSIPGAKPHETFPVFVHISDDIMGKSVFGGIMIYPAFGLGKTVQYRKNTIQQGT
jgi:hypothetical protein